MSRQLGEALMGSLGKPNDRVVVRRRQSRNHESQLINEQVPMARPSDASTQATRMMVMVMVAEWRGGICQTHKGNTHANTSQADQTKTTL